ncbi:FAD-dependent oxidoreductase [Sporomusa acidovorans]|uniref:Thiamine thiazole synthase n=1 Tax=Sporomusa acidovorans (strain ATCC 49682 / DSM 3132 / Mol) TaxID=1123286 RepID=A0ABZ3J8K1_SPOA4|nr:FAD-dependent oxidoreductase [Sporomusa acidovorans]OZC16109.1 electron transfer flavoprotein-ubiquinone oxidoreductase [Sporomusa acidovorans DSM 3132]SDD86494.1 electron transfer flavoprotein-quinone oxidoreductase [Sporomusa acidovorans]
MDEQEKFDAIIIGAGPAGTACAYILAREGKNVLVIERGVSAGCKNVTGGRLYTYALELVEPGLHEEAPLERKVVREQIMLLGAGSAITVDYLDYTFKQDIPQSYSILRAPFDEWFAGKAEEQGAMIAPGILVDDLIIQDNKVIGVKAGEDEMYAAVVIAADGINSFMAQKAGLRSDITGHMAGVGVKEIIELPAETIQQRFNLAADEGTARMIIGCTEGIQGGGFLYTNKDSISLGIVFSPESAAKQGKSIQQIYQDFKMHPAIFPLIGDGNSVEYGAHLVPESGWRGVPGKLYRDGFLITGDAAGFCINTGTILRGIDLAIVSGVAAARAVIKTADNAAIGPAYVKELEELGLIPTMKMFAGWPDIVAIPRMAETYPRLANDVVRFMFAVDGSVPQKMPKAMKNIVKRHISIGQLLSDGWKGVTSV